MIREALSEALIFAGEDTPSRERARTRFLRSTAATLLEYYKNSAARGEGLEAYRQGLKAIQELCQTPQLQLLWAAQSSLARRCFSELRLPRENIPDIAEAWLIRAIWQFVWGEDLRRLTAADSAQVLHVCGLELLPHNWRSTGIVFVHRHTPFALAFWTWLKNAGIAPGVVIGRSRWDLPERDRADPVAVILQSARDLRRAQDALSGGTHVHTLPDALNGRRGQPFAFNGRVRDFQPSFAQQALRANAGVHPVDVYLDPLGNVVISFGPDFRTVARDRNVPLGVSDLVCMYADHVATAWNYMPQEIIPLHLLKFMMMPRAECGARQDVVKPPDPKIAVCVGLYGSGSTWVFNIMRELWLAEAGSKVALRSMYLDEETALPADLLEWPYIVLKMHMPSDALLRLLAVSRATVIVTIRDPLDAVASLICRFGMAFHEALAKVETSAKALLQLKGMRETVILRYEDGGIGRTDAFDEIASRLGARPSQALREEILAKLNPDAVRAQIDALSEMGTINDEQTWDNETHWHRGHIGDGRIGKFRDVLSERQQGLVAWRTATFAKTFGYASHEPQSPPRLAIFTDVALWEADTLFTAWVWRFVEIVGRTLPLTLFYIGDHEPAPPHAPSWLRFTRTGRELQDLSDASSKEDLLGAVIACADCGIGEACTMVCTSQGAGRDLALLTFTARHCESPHLAVMRSGVTRSIYLIGPLRRMAILEEKDPLEQLDRSKVLVIKAAPACAWDDLAARCLDALAIARGITVLSLICEAGAEHSKAFAQGLMQCLTHPVVFIGRHGVAWRFCRPQLELAGIPHLHLSAASIVPMVRASDGLPSLVHSIANFLDNPIPSPIAQQIADEEWQNLLRMLMSS